MAHRAAQSPPQPPSPNPPESPQNPLQNPERNDSSSGDYLRDAAFIPNTVDGGFGTQDAAEQPAAEPVAPVIPVEMIVRALGPSFEAIFKAIASARGAHWRLDDLERKTLAEGWAPIVQLLLAKLGNSEQVALTLALMSTSAIVAGKVVQDGIRAASSKASTKTPASVDSSASSASVEAARAPGQRISFVELDG